MLVFMSALATCEMTSLMLAAGSILLETDLSRGRVEGGKKKVRKNKIPYRYLKKSLLFFPFKKN